MEEDTGGLEPQGRAPSTWPIQVTWAARGRGGGQGSLLGAGARGWGWGRAAPSFSEPSPAHPWAHGPTVARATPGRRRRGGGRGARSPGRWGRSGRRRRGTPRGSSPRRSPARRPGRRRPNLERGAAREPRRPGQQDGDPERGVCPEAFPRGAAAGPARPQALGRAGRCRQRLAAGLLGQGHGRGRTRGGGVTPGRPQGPSHAANTCEKGQPELRRLPCLKGTLAGSQPSLAHRVLATAAGAGPARQLPAHALGTLSPARSPPRARGARQTPDDSNRIRSGVQPPRRPLLPQFDSGPNTARSTPPGGFHPAAP